MAWANSKKALVKAKKWQEDEPSRLTEVKENAKVEIRHKAMAKVI